MLFVSISVSYDLDLSLGDSDLDSDLPVGDSDLDSQVGDSDLDLPVGDSTTTLEIGCHTGQPYSYTLQSDRRLEQQTCKMSVEFEITAQKLQV